MRPERRARTIRAFAAASPARRLVMRAAALALMASVIITASGAAQRHDKRVTLRIAPRVGDTILTHLTQSMDLVGTARVANGDSTMRVHSELELYSRVIVEARSDRGTTVTSRTDSAAASSAGGRSVATPDALRAAFVGKQVRLRISPEGSATVLTAPEGLPADVASIISQVPAMLPAAPVAVGESWTHRMTIPISGAAGVNGAMLETTYRLDSLSGDGKMAYISMNGRLTRDEGAGELPSGALLSSEGTLTGTLVVDRERGWWHDSQATVHVRSVVTPARGGPDRRATLQLTVTQRLHTGERP
ncbi:MAG TPA: DUF6263 family protein [Gemmatimonadaceae bacterium]|nr:DUF6263 family protein [Gemmatimonadaceae bacterium]